MKRELKDIENDLKLAQDRLKPIQEARDKAVDEVNKYFRELQQYKLDNGLFTPISELRKYIGKHIRSISLVEKLEDGTLEVEDMYGDEYFKIDDDGNLDYSSEFDGVMDYDKNIQKYVMWCHYCRTEHDYIGYLSLEFDDED